MIGFGRTPYNREGLGYEGTSTGAAQFVKEHNPDPVAKIDEIRMPQSASKSEQGLITYCQSPQVSKM